MTPTVGRIVHFYTADSSEQSNAAGTGPYAAVVTRVWGEGDNCAVNLAVFQDAGTLQAITSVSGLNTEGPVPGELESGPYWVWPPRD